VKKTFWSVIKIIFFLGLGGFFIWLFVHNLTSDQISQIWQSFKRADYSWILLAVITGVISHASRARRWMILLEPMGYKPRFWNVFMAVFTGYLANLALPRLGEVSRCGVLTRYEKVPFNKGFGTVITERAIDMIFFLMLFFVNFVIQFRHLKNYIYDKVYMPLLLKLEAAGNASMMMFTVAMVIFIIVILVFIFRKKFYHLGFVIKIRDLIKGLVEGMKSLISIRRPGEFVFHTFLIWGCYFTMTWLVFFSLPETSMLGLDAGLAVLVFGSIGIILVQGGIGVYPVIVAETLVLYNIDSLTGYSMGWILWSAQTFILVFIGGLSMMGLPIINRLIYDKKRN
jgi:uncharacterized protein (TIRG00374 family)